MARIEYNYPLLSHNTFGIEAYADRFVAYDSVEDLRQVVRRLRADCPDVPVLHIGGGSNLLFLSDFKGVVLFSSHDHEFVQTIANRIREFHDGKLTAKLGTYEEYLESQRA